MYYVMSDLHGQDELFFKMLKKIEFSSKDILYILGDVISRGPGSIKILEYIMRNDNVILIKGNHEAFFIDYYENNKHNLNKKHPWLKYGGLDTYNEIMSRQDGPKCFERIADYLTTLPLIKTVSVGKCNYTLAHAEVFISDGRIDAVQFEQNLLWGHMNEQRPVDLKNNHILITGHLRTSDFNDDHSTDIYFENSWILLDGGCGFGGSLNCLRLDDWQIFSQQ